jgi:hypothetical protein
MIEKQGKHYYPTDGHIWTVSAEAAQERRASYVEIPDVCDGYAYVTRPDWHALFEYYHTHYAQDHTCAGSGAAYLVNVHDPDGKIVHIGSISRSYLHPDAIYLSG